MKDAVVLLGVAFGDPVAIERHMVALLRIASRTAVRATTRVQRAVRLRFKEQACRRIQRRLRSVWHRQRRHNKLRRRNGAAVVLQTMGRRDRCLHTPEVLRSNGVALISVHLIVVYIPRHEVLRSKCDTVRSQSENIAPPRDEATGRSLYLATSLASLATTKRHEGCRRPLGRGLWRSGRD